MKNVFKKFGFTLAEVLIAVGIIGTIAAMTIPTLKKSYEEHVFESRAKATYNHLQQAVALSKYAGDRFIPAATAANTREVAQNFYEKYFKNTLKVAMFCKDLTSSGTKCWGERREEHYDPSTNSYDQNNYSIFALPDINGNGNLYNDEGVSFRMDSGAEVRIAIHRSREYLEPNKFGAKLIDNYRGNNVLYVLFDSNGGANEPNALGYDIYVLVWNGVELVPAGSNATAVQVTNNCKLDTTGGFGLRGALCLQYMIDNGWRINKDLF